MITSTLVLHCVVSYCIVSSCVADDSSVRGETTGEFSSNFSLVLAEVCIFPSEMHDSQTPLAQEPGLRRSLVLGEASAQFLLRQGFQSPSIRP